MNTYFKLELITKYILPLIGIITLVVLLMIRTVLDCIRINRINKHFESHGYKRKLLGVSSFAGEVFMVGERNPMVK